MYLNSASRRGVTVYSYSNTCPNTQMALLSTLYLYLITSVLDQ